MKPRHAAALVLVLFTVACGKSHHPGVDDPFVGGTPVHADSLAGVHYSPVNGFCLQSWPGMPDFASEDCICGFDPPPREIDVDIRSSARDCAQHYGKQVVVDGTAPPTFKLKVGNQGVDIWTWCGNFNAQLRAAGYAPVKDLSNKKLFRLVPVTRTAG